MLLGNKYTKYVLSAEILFKIRLLYAMHKDIPLIEGHLQFLKDLGPFRLLGIKTHARYDYDTLFLKQVGGRDRLFKLTVKKSGENSRTVCELIASRTDGRIVWDDLNELQPDPIILDIVDVKGAWVLDEHHERQKYII